MKEYMLSWTTLYRKKKGVVVKSDKRILPPING
jgi:hypothetical protein